MKIKNKIIEIDVSKIIGIDDEEVDDSVGYYQPFCIVGENEDKEQIQLFLNYDTLITLCLKLKPYLDDCEAREKMDNELYEEYIEDKI